LNVVSPGLSALQARFESENSITPPKASATSGHTLEIRFTVPPSIIAGLRLRGVTSILSKAS
jgi:hypothetical protein